MTDELQQAIQQLYETFSVYPFNARIAGCPCCVLKTDTENLHVKPLRQLDGSDLSTYAFKAMTTWGSTQDFKYYLPRIFELLATTRFEVDTFVVLGKLEYGKWRTWPRKEQRIIEIFLFAWWTDDVKNNYYFNDQLFFEILKLTGNINNMLDVWTVNVPDCGFIIYVNFVQQYYPDLLYEQGKFECLDKLSSRQLLIWTDDNAWKMEEGLLYYRDRCDGPTIERISRAVNIYNTTI